MYENVKIKNLQKSALKLHNYLSILRSIFLWLAKKDFGDWSLKQPIILLHDLEVWFYIMLFHYSKIESK